MLTFSALATFTLSLSGLLPQALPPRPLPSRPAFDAFDVATIKLVESDAKSGRFIKMENPHRFVERDYTLKLLIAAAFELSPRTISGGPAWTDADHFDIQAITPGDVQPTRPEQMRMLRALLTERFKLTFHREQKDIAIYAMDVARSGAKPDPGLKPTTAQPGDPTIMGPGVVYPQRIVLPAQNASLFDLASILQRAILDRPVVDRTGLSGHYDFSLEWAPDDSQFGGAVPAPADTTPALPLFQAIQQQLGLKLTATHGPVSALIIDHADHPSAD